MWKGCIRIMIKNIFKRICVCALSSAMLISMAACNTKIDVKYEYKALDYVTLGEYKGIEVSVDLDTIEKTLIDKRIQSDIEENTTYTDVTSRGAADGDVVTVDFTGKIGGVQVNGFTDEDYEIELGADTFVIDGFVDELYGMKAGEEKVVTLVVPEDFETAAEYAGKRIVYEISVDSVKQANVPMVTDAYAKEYFNCDTVEDYKKQIAAEIGETIEEEKQKIKEEAVLTKLQSLCTVTSYPEEFLNSKREEYSQSISFYSTMLELSTDEYCQQYFGISFEEYVKKAVAQEMILQAIVETENMEIYEYDYKGNLESFAHDMGFNSKTTFEEKYGKDKIVRNMLLQRAQDLVMDNVVYK